MLQVRTAGTSKVSLRAARTPSDWCLDRMYRSSDSPAQMAVGKALACELRVAPAPARKPMQNHLRTAAFGTPGNIGQGSLRDRCEETLLSAPRARPKL